MLNEETFKKMETISKINNAVYKHQQILSTPIYQAALAMQKEVQPLMSVAMNAVTSWQVMLNPLILAIQSFCQKHEAEIMEMAKTIPFIQAMNVMRQHQYVQWSKLDKEFVDEILCAEDKEIDDILYNFEMKDDGLKLNNTIMQCRNSNYLKNHLRLFDQAIDTYKNGQYEISVMALFALLDSALSASSEDNETSIIKRLEKIINKMDFPLFVEDSKYSRWILIMTFCSTIESISEYSNFYDNEPLILNRHWIMHGRSTREIRPIDCIKVLNCIYGVILIDQIRQEEII